MSGLALPYSGSEVRTTEQAKEFLDRVFIPAADLLAGCSFVDSGQYQVYREHQIRISDNAGDWTEVGFQATRLDVDDNRQDIIYNLWAYNGADTSTFPFPEAAAKAAEILAKQGAFGEKYIEEMFGSEMDDDEFDIEYCDEVVEQKDFYIASSILKPIRDFDFAYARNGVTVYLDSSASCSVDQDRKDALSKYDMLLGAEKEFSSAFDELDLELIAGVLARLSLLTKR